MKISADMDRVIATVNNVAINLPYSAAFKIAQNLAIASSHAMRINNVTESRDQFIPDTEVLDASPSSEVRRTVGGKFTWSIDVDSELVILTIEKVVMKLHFTKAIELGYYLRQQGRVAKLWAGDTSKSMIASGMLTDAEADYKRNPTF